MGRPGAAPQVVEDEPAVGSRLVLLVALVLGVVVTVPTPPAAATELVPLADPTTRHEVGWLASPLPAGRVTRGFSPRHAGVDLAIAGPGDDRDDVLALAAGEVVHADATCARQTGATGARAGRRCGNGFGNHVVLRHVLADGRVLFSSYSHLDAVHRRSGCVDRGTPIGEVGHTGHSTGEHLHLEVNTDPRLRGHETGPASVDPGQLLGSDAPVLPCVPRPSVTTGPPVVVTPAARGVR